MTTPFGTDGLSQGYYTNVGTVLQRRDASGEGRSLLIFLRDLGPRWVSAPGSAAKHRFGGAVEPLVWSRYDLYQSPTRLYLKGAEIREDFVSLRGSAEKLRAALKFYKRLPRLVMVGHESNKILTLLWSSLTLLKENCPIQAVEFRYAWRLLRERGSAPSLRYCVKCGDKLSSGAKWSADGLLCAACGGSGHGAIDISDLALIQRGALLSHENFIAWSGSLPESKLALFEEVSGKLVTFFADLD